ncbi:MAG: bifunctional adenosylcobinamide kinase/adenosylcobinamide-phosphate guanylyltransferase [Candidatus Lindowbacteria bacterium]|nr:bifunctional adenosylcobinamide kinase/adenosylcobinamide-phosphate guanylyltransferase [Candidatus Lindowbacteria bacterium]
MGKITLVLGGTRSGKSEIAEGLAGQSTDVTYIATCIAGDDSLKERVQVHRDRRPKEWATIEEPLNLSAGIKAVPSDTTACLIDCLSLFVFNCQQEHADDSIVLDKVNTFVESAKSASFESIVVSNDVSNALVPTDAESQRYQNLLGRANQTVAAAAEKVILAVAGVPVVIKGD